MVTGNGEHFAIRGESQGRNHGRRGVGRRGSELERPGSGGRIIFGALANPALDQRDLGFTQRIAFLGHVRLLAADLFDDSAFFGVAGREGGAVLASFLEGFVSSQIKLAFQFARMMTSGTTPFEHGYNVLVKTDRLVRSNGGEKGESKDGEHPNQARAWPNDERFPLTPALSLRKRENLRQLIGGLDRGRNATRRATLLPLLGERAGVSRNETSEKKLANKPGRNAHHRNHSHFGFVGAVTAAGGAFVATSVCSGGVILSEIFPVRAL